MVSVIVLQNQALRKGLALCNEDPAKILERDGMFCGRSISFHLES